MATIIFNPIGPPFEFTNDTGVVGSITITGDTGGPQTASTFGITGGTGGIQFDWNGSSFKINSTSLGFTWTTVSGTSQAMLPGNGYVTVNGALTTLTLPTTSNVGDTFKIINTGGGGIRISQNANQGILIGDVATTLGVTGFVTSSGVTQNYSSVEIVCVLSDSITPQYLYAATATIGIFGAN